jgi:hypothetical protein
LEYLVFGAMLLFIASFVYPPLGRAMRDFGQRLDGRPKQSWNRRKIVGKDTMAHLVEDQAPEVMISPTPEARPSFGKRKTIEEPRRPAQPPSGQIFNKELFEGERGEFLRKHGYAPDDPRNQAVNVQPLSALLAEDLAGLRRAAEAVNKAASFPIEPWHLLPLTLWRGEFGAWLRQHLDLSPCRPWNTIFLPGDETGAKALGLPVGPQQPDAISDETKAMLAIIQETYAGMHPAEEEAVRIMLDGVRSNTPQLFPPDIGDFSDRVRRARADVRALAFATAVTGGGIDAATIVKSQNTFLGIPEQQLVS